ncbi:MAG: hypothetical protein ACRD50_14780 [Candidatus Acidiferrales bacterium]
MKRILAAAVISILAILAASGQQTKSPGVNAPQAAVAPSPEFLKAADEVLADMGRILDLPPKESLKKSLRSKEEIRAYLVKEMNEDRSPAERAADEKVLEAFGLLPRGFPLESFLLDVLTDQVAGLYDPKEHEFYIADWIPADEQKPVMAHELTHALDDQYFHIDAWEKAARPNDDAELARDSVIEGSAIAAMLDYTLRDSKLSIREMPDVTALLSSQALGEMAKDPHLAKAPPIIGDELLFPYLAGTGFSQKFLKSNTGWGDFKKVFADPPVSTQQILHPELYLSGQKPANVTLPDISAALPVGWKKLEENVLGEFGLNEVLKQFLGQERAEKDSPSWAGDRYVLYQNEKEDRRLLIYRLHLRSPDAATDFMSEYSELLQLKYKVRTPVHKQGETLWFQAGAGGVYLRCHESECLVVEGAEREWFDKINQAMGWAAVSQSSQSTYISPTPETAVPTPVAEAR